MKRWHIIFDVNKCIGCYTCMLACKDEHVGNEWLPYTDKQKKRDQKWILMGRRERGVVPRVDIAYRPTICNHCDDPPCAEAVPGCVIKRSDGIVLLDPRKAVGNEDLVKACPFGAISWNDEANAAQKCTLCAHLLDDGWKEPRCVQSCSLRALMAIHMEDAEFEKLVVEKGLVSIAPEHVMPRVWYKNLHRFTENMIAGEIAYIEDGEEVCAENVEVLLTKDGETVASTYTSAYGEFYFDPVAPNSGDYEVKAELPGRGSVSHKLAMGDESIDIGLMRPGMEPEPSHYDWKPIRE
ncbi:MAG: oxidoreductase [Clostridiales bacterium]|nr:oxidoreductase [Clostridiales bacterium]